MNDQAISALQALANTLTDQQKGLQGQIDAINQAITALQNGGAVAQTEIDQAVSDQVTAALAPVQTSITNVLSNAKTIDSPPSTSDSVVLAPASDSTPAVTP